MRCANASTTVVLLFEQKVLSLGQMKHGNETQQKGTRGCANPDTAPLCLCFLPDYSLM